MGYLLSTSLVGLVILFSCVKSFKWLQNYQAARATRFPVYISPIHFFDAWWLVGHPILVPILEKLPKAWTSPWLQISQTWMIWKNGYQPFEAAGSDTFILATPNGNMLWSSNNRVNQQILTLHPKIEQPDEILKFWDIWGPTIGSVQGNEWKAHRKVVAGAFGSAINQKVWEEAKQQTETLVAHWIDHQGSLISVARMWTSRLALHVIAAVFFNMQLHWDDDRNPTPLPTGHNLHFHEALFKMLGHLLTIYVTPRRLLGILPGKIFKEAYVGLTETTTYFRDLQAETTENIDEVLITKDRTLLEAIVLAAADPEITGKIPLPEGSVMGNTFFTLFAGHETVGGSLGFILVLLAVYPDCQKLVQEQLDMQLGTRPKSEWTLEEDFLALQDGYIGAIQKETLYLYNPAVLITRRTVEAVTISSSEGSAHLIPKDTMTLINIPGSARNPAVWKKPPVLSERRAALSDSPALYFNPGRWLENNDRSEETGATPPQWFPFGAGGRTCPGRAFAQTETTSVMATLFKSHSLELVVQEQTLLECQGGQEVAWAKTRDNAIKMLYDDIGSNMSISLMKELPIRIVPRPN